MTKKQVSTDDLISVIIQGIEEVKGENIQLYPSSTIPYYYL